MQEDVKMSNYGLVKEMSAEFIGTFILVFFGVGSVCVSVWLGAYAYGSSP